MIEREENFYEASYKIFYEFSQTKPESFGLEFSRNLTYPVLKLNTNARVVIPLPKIIGEKYVFEGLFFDNTEIARKSMWALFLSTVYHMAGHAAVSNYTAYETWIKNKTENISWKVIDFIEDIFVNKYVRHNSNIVWENIQSVDERLIKLQTEANMKNISKQMNLSYDFKNVGKKLQDIKDKISSQVIREHGNDSILSFANYLYKNRELLPKQQLPYRERHNEDWPFGFENKTIEFTPHGEFETQIGKLDELWEIEERFRRKIFRRYKKYLKNTHFDTVIIPSGNFQSYVQIRLKTLPMLRQIVQQIRLIANVTDYPKIDQIGYLDMQMAIQAISSEGQSTDIYERDDIRRNEEAWVILVDTSASMNLRFEELKEFVVCVSESANELTGKFDAWGLYSFDNNFHILKDFKEKYNHEVKARIGGIKHGGLSLLPDAIEIANGVLNEDPREKKYIFVITDGSPSGYTGIQKAFSKVVKKTDLSGTTLVAIGIAKSVTKRFRNSARATNLRQLVAKFITVYKSVASSDM